MAKNDSKHLHVHQSLEYKVCREKGEKLVPSQGQWKLCEKQRYMDQTVLHCNIQASLTMSEAPHSDSRDLSFSPSSAIASLEVLGLSE